MRLNVTRQIADQECTIGQMSVDDVFECYTLEPPPLLNVDLIAPKGCIPPGTYNVTITFSGHFQRNMPLVNDVPNFSEIRIHPGNFPANTEGCCCVGETSGKDQILQSVAAFNILFAKIQAAIASGDTVQITYA